MASRSLFKGSACKQTCRGHRAGYKYAKSGGTKFSHSTSFNNGMKIAMGLLPKRRRK
jgi:hypothetical protein